VAFVAFTKLLIRSLNAFCPVEHDIRAFSNRNYVFGCNVVVEL